MPTEAEKAEEAARLRKEIEADQLRAEIAAEQSGGAPEERSTKQIIGRGLKRVSQALLATMSPPGADVFTKKGIKFLDEQSDEDIADANAIAAQVVVPGMAGMGTFNVLRQGALAGPSIVRAGAAGLGAGAAELGVSQALEEIGVGEDTSVTDPLNLATIPLSTAGGVIEGVQSARPLVRALGAVDEVDAPIARSIQTSGGKTISSSNTDTVIRQQLARGEGTFKNSKIFKNTGRYDPIKGVFEPGTVSSKAASGKDALARFEDAIAQGAELRQSAIEAYEEGLAALNQPLLVGSGETIDSFRKSKRGAKVVDKIAKNSEFEFLRDNAEAMDRIIDEVFTAPGTQTALVDQFGVPLVKDDALGIAGLDNFIRAIDEKLKGLEAYDVTRIGREINKESGKVVTNVLDPEEGKILEQLASKDYSAVAELLTAIRSHVADTRNGLIKQAFNTITKNADNVPEEVLRHVREVSPEIFVRNLNDTHHFINGRKALEKNLGISVPRASGARGSVGRGGFNVGFSSGDEVSPALDLAERGEFTRNFLNQASELTELSAAERFFQSAADAAPFISRTVPRVLARPDIDVGKIAKEGTAAVAEIGSALEARMLEAGIEDAEAQAQSIMTRIADTIRTDPREAAFQLAEADKQFNIFPGNKLPGSILLNGKRIVPNPQTRLMHRDEATRLLRAGEIDSQQYQQFVSGLESGLTFIPDSMKVDSEEREEKAPGILESFRQRRGQAPPLIQ